MPERSRRGVRSHAARGCAARVEGLLRCAARLMARSTGCLRSLVWACLRLWLPHESQRCGDRSRCDELWGVDACAVSATDPRIETKRRTCAGTMPASPRSREGSQRTVHHQIASRILSIMGSTKSKILIGFGLSSYILSMWISNTATTLMMLPMALSIIQTQKGSNLIVYC